MPTHENSPQIQKHGNSTKLLKTDNQDRITSTITLIPHLPFELVKGSLLFYKINTTLKFESSKETIWATWQT